MSPTPQPLKLSKFNLCISAAIKKPKTKRKANAQSNAAVSTSGTENLFFVELALSSIC